MITEFNGEYRFLSNFYPCTVVYKFGLQHRAYPTAEHAYQVQKCLNPYDMLKIAEASTPGEAKRVGRNTALSAEGVAAWDARKKAVMLEVVLEKFSQNEDLAKRLVATGDELLIEGNTWHDNYWGKCSCYSCVLKFHQPQAEYLASKMVWHDGKNYLGQILMAVRMVLA